MASLHRHLLTVEDVDHDRLAFRADCPRCAPRQSGLYPGAHVLSHRGEAALTTGLVVAGALLPAGAAAAKDEAQRPSTPPAVVIADAQRNGQDRSEGNRGGGDERGPDTGQGGDASAPAAPQRPPVEVSAPDPQSSPEPGSVEDSSAPEVPAAGPGASKGGGRDSQGDSPPSPNPSGGQPGSSGDSGYGGRGHPDEAGPGAGEQAPTNSQRGPSSPSGASKGDGGNDSSSKPGGDASDRHVVQPGESLWTIVEERLGDAADDAQIAAGVQHVWDRNANRIATGNPSLIYPGQILDLR